MDEFTLNIIKEFDFKPKYIKKLKYMHICYTDKGNKLLKPINMSIDKILFINKVKQHLKNNGYDKIDFYHISKSNLPYVTKDGITYVLTDYLDFEECDFSKREDIIKSTEAIAAFHKLCQNSSKDFNEANTNTTNIKSIFLQKFEILKKLKKLVSKQRNFSDFDVIFLKNYNYFYEQAITSIEILDKYSYENLNKKALKKVMLCHNKLKEESLLLNNGNIYMSNMEDITIDHFINDLNSFILRYIRKHENNDLKLKDILNTYEKIHHIENSVLPILYAMLIFPMNYVSTCETFYERKRSFTPISISSQIENILTLREYKESFISDIKPNI